MYYNDRDEGEYIVHRSGNVGYLRSRNDFYDDENINTNAATGTVMYLFILD